MESIIQYRQMMAEQKFFEVQRLIEVQLTIKSEARHELLRTYYDVLKAQDKKLPTNYLLELAQHSSEAKDHNFVLKIIDELTKADIQKYYFKILKLKIRAAEDKGQMDILYSNLSEFLLRQFERQAPVCPDWITESINKFFKNDFNLKLKELVLTLMLGDHAKSEELIKQLIISCIEKSSPRGVATKILSIGDVIRIGTEKSILEIYHNFCKIFANGISEKADYKRITEMVVYFEDFKFQVMILNLLHKLELNDVLLEYSVSVKENQQYNFVYLDKFYPQLKYLFVTNAEKTEPEPPFIEVPDLKLTSNYKPEIITPIIENDEIEEEQRYYHLLKYQTYTSDQLCDLAVSFIQSEMPKIALRASEMAMDVALDDKEFLKGSYLKVTALLQLRDYRAAMDSCLIALNRAKSQDDLLSFLYAQAEICIRLNQSKQAKELLSKVLSIDSQYRMAKERLNKLNEI